MRNAAERKDIRKYEKLAKLREDERINFVVGSMSLRQGRAYYHDLLAACHIFNDPFTGDALVEAYSKGERNVGLRIYNDLVTHCPEYFVLMMQEANEKEIINERSPDPAGGDADPIDTPDSDEFTGGADA